MESRNMHQPDNAPSSGNSGVKRGARRQGRELALKVLYGMSEHDCEPRQALDRFWSNFRFAEDIIGDPLDDATNPLPIDVVTFAEGLVLGVHSHLDLIDKAVKEFSTNWALDRMAKVDLAILRLACYELLFSPSVPSSVIINEAIEIGKRFGAQETPAFVNGILDQISRKHRPK